jgi:hypothetical protein
MAKTPLGGYPDIKCEWCNEYFTPTHPNHRFCCKECGKAFQKSEYIKYKEITDFVIFERDNFRCVYCGKSSIEDGVKLILEHIYPINRGGNAELFNIATSCSVCNGQKSNRMMSDDNILRLWNEIERRNEASGAEHHQMLVDKLRQQLKNRQERG